MTVAVTDEPGVVLRPLTRRQYDALVATGALDDVPVELLEGALVEVAPQGPEHSWVVERVLPHLVRRLPEQYSVRPGLPWVADDLSEPEPDLAVVPRRSHRQEHPQQALLIVEVSRSSLAKDLGVKARVYARAGAGAYWVVDVEAERVHVHTGPSATGWDDVVVRRYDEPLQVAGVEVVLAELLRPDPH